MDQLKAEWRKAMDAERDHFPAQENDALTPPSGAEAYFAV